jgi:SRSO17 transposase
VSLSIATPQDHVAIDFELYLPECWANDPARRDEGRIPEDVPFKTKPRLALDMLRRAVKAKLPRGTVLADESYGGSRSRPERHYHDSLITIRLAFARAIARWLPRCPVCHATHRHRGHPRVPLHEAEW